MNILKLNFSVKNAALTEGGTHDIAKALNGGQDLEMGGGPDTKARNFLAEDIKNGKEIK